MTDPIAEAAAKIAADAAPSSTEPSLLEKAINTIHDLEAKVEHLIHPETPPNVATVALEATSGATVSTTALASEGSEAPNALTVSTSGTQPESKSSADTSTTTGSATSSGGDAGNVLAAATASSLPQSSTSAVQTLPETSMQKSTVSSENVEAGNVIGAVQSATDGSATAMNLDASSSTLTSQANALLPGGEVPNVAPAAVEKLGSQTSAAPVSTPDGIPGIVASSPAEPVKLASAATSGIKSNIANIKHHLSIRGFEQSAVADIHAELEAIEKWL